MNIFDTLENNKRRKVYLKGLSAVYDSESKETLRKALSYLQEMSELRKKEESHTYYMGRNTDKLISDLAFHTNIDTMYKQAQTNLIKLLRTPKWTCLCGKRFEILLGLGEQQTNSAPIDIDIDIAYIKSLLQQ